MQQLQSLHSHEITQSWQPALFRSLADAARVIALMHVQHSHAQGFCGKLHAHIREVDHEMCAPGGVQRRLASRNGWNGASSWPVFTMLAEL